MYVYDLYVVMWMDKIEMYYIYPYVFIYVM